MCNHLRKKRMIDKPGDTHMFLPVNMATPVISMETTHAMATTKYLVFSVEPAMR